MHTLKLAEVSIGSRNGSAQSRLLRQTKLFSSIWDISELLQLNCSEKQEMNQHNLQFHHRRAKAGEPIYRLGQLFESLYIVRFGFLKVVLRNAEGDERVLSFPMKGNVLGFEGIYCNQYGTEAIALTDCELVVIPFKQLLTRDDACRELEQMIYVAISRELTEGYAGVSLSSPLKSEARVARFLDELVKRYAALGYSSKEISLPMTRRDIGCYLGLTLETVSRSLSTLATKGMISVHREKIHILEPKFLHLFHSSLPYHQLIAKDHIERPLIN
ncbi:Crp/Fnr family transcriptional regulator [Alcaligenaceae bacterium]|nr:Crp/Fnr family transcriptional regulator [Alcaligenaceae bacterium]